MRGKGRRQQKESEGQGCDFICIIQCIVEITSAFELPENYFFVTVQKMSDEITNF